MSVVSPVSALSVLVSTLSHTRASTIQSGQSHLDSSNDYMIHSESKMRRKPFRNKIGKQSSKVGGGDRDIREKVVN